MKRIWLVLVVLVALAGLAFAQSAGVKQKQPKPYDFGTMTLNSRSTAAGMAPVTFEHWSHRAQYTCRLCHVDLGFAMKSGGTEITVADNQRGYYCGACHNGKVGPGGKTVFKACEKGSTAAEDPRCARCHQRERDPARAEVFFLFAEKMPKERLGNGINWELAEEKGLIKPIDTLPGISIPRKPMAVQKDFALESKVGGMPDIIFSHKKHTVWNGCEICHPDIFAGVQKGATKYSMLDISAGKYCGMCHKTVAFPMQDCQRCHSKPVNS